MIYNSFLAKNISASIPLAIPVGTDVCNTSLHPPPDHNPVTACRPCRGLDERGKHLIYRALTPLPGSVAIGMHAVLFLLR